MMRFEVYECNECENLGMIEVVEIGSLEDLFEYMRQLEQMFDGARVCCYEGEIYVNWD